jgi:uncharacterized SAM-binding protein YcdF (DUF218 family)
MPQLLDNDRKMKGPHETSPPRQASGAGTGATLLRRWGLRVLAKTLIVIVVCSLAFLGGFAAFATHVARLTTPEEPGNADAIIVLTGGEKRLDAAMDLLESGKGQRLLISGVHPSARIVDLQRATGGDAKLFSCCVDIDRAALDTIGNAEESAKWINSHAWDTIIVVTNNYHMPRSLLELRRYIGDVNLVPYPVVNTRLDGGEWMTNRAALRVLFTEYAKYLVSLGRGLLPRTTEGDDGGMMSVSVFGAR